MSLSVFPFTVMRGLTLLPALLQKQQALIGQMLMEGYGCERDPAAGKEWADKARRRGYRMAGVYSELEEEPACANWTSAWR